MGYHFAIDSFGYPQKCSAADTLEFELCIENSGVAPIYRYIPLRIRLSDGKNSYAFETSVDIRKWIPGKLIERFEITLPEHIARGEYTIEIGIYNENVPVLYLCTDAQRNGSFYKVGRITVE